MPISDLDTWLFMHVQHNKPLFLMLQTTEYVVLHTDLAAEDIQNVEIVTDGDINSDTILNTVNNDENTYVVVSEPGNHLRIIDSSTGLTVATMPAGSDQLPEVSLSSEVETDSVTVHTDTVHADTGPLTTSQEESESNKMEHDSATLMPSETTETITVHTDAGPITVVGGEEVADAVKHAMMVADVVEGSGGETPVGELQVVLTHAAEVPTTTQTTAETQQ